MGFITGVMSYSLISGRHAWARTLQEFDEMGCCAVAGFEFQGDDITQKSNPINTSHCGQNLR